MLDDPSDFYDRCDDVVVVVPTPDGRAQHLPAYRVVCPDCGGDYDGMAWVHAAAYDRLVGEPWLECDCGARFHPAEDDTGEPRDPERGPIWVI